MIKEKPLVIKPLLIDPKSNVLGLFTFRTGQIELGTDEKDTIPVLVHEQIHKLLYETINWRTTKEKQKGVWQGKASVQWDKIDELVLKHVYPKFNPYAKNYALKHSKKQKPVLRGIINKMKQQRKL